ncbi:hypothetical protein AT251_23405 [Enterovibrio nigricans]|nr:hypothetical protein AT251_23405 [Enterovibrio nigricans]
MGKSTLQIRAQFPLLTKWSKGTNPPKTGRNSPFEDIYDFDQYIDMARIGASEQKRYQKDGCVLRTR